MHTEELWGWEGRKKRGNGLKSKIINTEVEKNPQICTRYASLA